jgi:DDE_Tnp_1-associated
MTAVSPASLLEFLATVPDPRPAHGRRHPLAAMLAAVCGAILCGARGFRPIAQWLHDQDIALVHAPGFTRKPPTWGAFRKLLIALDPTPFEGASARWAEAALASSPPGAEGGDALEPVALDGKAVRGSLGRHEGAVHLLSVMAQRCGLTPRQTEVGSKTNEHEAAPGLLPGLVLEGRVVTGDAMSCQRDLCAGGPGRRALLHRGERRPARTPARHRRRAQPGRGRGFFPLASASTPRGSSPSTGRWTGMATGSSPDD